MMNKISKIIKKLSLFSRCQFTSQKCFFIEHISIFPNQPKGDLRIFQRSIETEFTKSVDTRKSVQLGLPRRIGSRRPGATTEAAGLKFIE